jgi:tRNA 5-methylaminomethyl-2-thiouridine biosynthesis bifunctional protein
MFDDIYFSPDDGPAETNHVFLKGNNLPARWARRNVFTVAELGFGTGLNFLLTAKLFMENYPQDGWLDYVAVEKYPLTATAIDAALRPFGDDLPLSLFDEFLAAYPPLIPGYHRINLGGRVRLTLLFDDVMKALPDLRVPRGVDAWFLDGFAPAKNPDMWQTPVFAEMARLSAPDATCATFTVAGMVKRGLTEAGFAIEKRPGFGRKREMLVGAYKGAGTSASITPPARVAIIGGGLAGTSAAWALRQRAIPAVIFESGNDLAPGASGNAAGLCNPRLSAVRTPQTDVYAAGYARAIKAFPALDLSFIARGNLHLMHTPEREKKFSGTAATWGWSTDHLRVLDCAAASNVAGIDLPCGGVFLPDTGLTDPAALCRAYAVDTIIRTGMTVSPQRDGAGWRIDDEYFDAVILAHGHAATDLLTLPLEPVRGQITTALVTANSGLAVNLCYGGYMGAARDGQHIIGATFQRGDEDVDVRAADDAENIAKLSAIFPELAAQMIPVSARAAVRCAARDRFPVAGVAGENLYVSTAHGSHGLVTSLAAAEMIADMITGSVLSLPESSVRALSPHRFVLREQTPKARRGRG